MPYGGTNLSRKQQQFLEKALQLAKLSDCKQKHGALITQGGKVISVGINAYRNDPRVCTNSIEASYHAETNALRSLRGRNLNNAIIFVARINRLEMPMLSKPCLKCAQEIEEAGIRKVIFTI
jgi:deoxycytidylate deaminase